MEQILWYRNPAAEWMEGLPIGNGRLAAMITGDEQQDVLCLNHEWLWRGVFRERDNQPAAAGQLENVRALMAAGDFFGATSLANTCFGGRGGISQMPHHNDAYQPAGDLSFSFAGPVRFIRRELDLVQATVGVLRQTEQGSEILARFIAHPDLNLIIAHWSGPIAGRLSFKRATDPDAIESGSADSCGLRYTCRFKGGLDYCVDIRIATDGVVRVDGDRLWIDRAGELTAFINIATSVRGVERELADYPAPLRMGWAGILASHQNRFASLMDRFQLNIDLPENPAPTDERIAAVKRGESDDGLPLLYFHYGRYLLAASSICGELPANLQGKWNDNIKPPWECDYHFDINLQMNYWMAEPANLSDCAEALLRFVERFLPHAEKAAGDLYGCRGVYLPIQTDAWGRSTPESFGWSVWIGAAPWIAQHFWWHYRYNGDPAFLRDRAYPFFRAVARFYEDYLVADEQGVMQIMPSQSPENRFAGTGFFPVSLGISAAMDVQLAYDALGYAIKSAAILDADQADADRWLTLQRHLPAFKIGSDGRLLEWEREREEVEPGHRHLSHLYGLYPSDLFNPDERPAQYEAAVRSLEFRLSRGGGHTGWSRAWVACLFARIGDGELLWEHVNALIKDFATISLLDLHPPRIFQIDGNLGAVAAIIEGLAQYWHGKLHLLRALPQAWRTGNLNGVKVPGGHAVRFSWQDGRVTKLSVTFGFERQLSVVVAGRTLILSGREGETVQVALESVNGHSEDA